MTLLTENGRAVGAAVQDGLSGRQIDVRASVVVTATGPWTQRVRGSKGAHIAVPRDRIGNRHALTLLSPRDGRVLFALPAGPHAIIGTTDTYTTASPDSVRPSNDDVRYLIDTANTFFPRASLLEADVVSAWAGIRPLLANAGDSPGAATREHSIATSADGVISITGGKLTTYRVMARDVVDAVVARLRRGETDARAKTTPLPGGDFSSLDDLIAEAARTTSDVALADHLTTSYGARWRAVWDEIDQGDRRAPLHDDLPYTIGELRYAVRHEMAATLGDLLIRRTHLAFETRDHGLDAAPRVASELAPLLGWDRESERRAVDDYAAEVERIFSIDAS
jgi:glycerol-3-phosphate dehydrogenase